jgi:hypothetical protein
MTDRREETNEEREAREASRAKEREAERGVPRGDHADEADREENPPHTTTGKITSPKFGSAGSGGAEYEGPLPKN